MTRQAGPVTRHDLLALTPDALAALANRGLVKRAARALDSDAAPTVDVDPDGTVHGRFPDGVATALPARADLGAASCTCGAPGVCRHRIGVVLAYQRRFGAEAADPTSSPGSFVPWSPGATDDATLARLFGAAALTVARRALTAGFPAHLVRARPDDPAPRAELRSCEVTFPVPHEVGYAHTDAADSARGEMVVLAVWAFRAADARGLTDDDVRLDVVGTSGGPAPHPDANAAPTPPGEPAASTPPGDSAASTPPGNSAVSTTADDPAAPGRGGEPALAAAVAALDELLLDGARHAGAVQRDALARAARDLDRRGLRWPAAALADLVEQLDAHRARSTRHTPQRLAELLAEVHARHRAARHGGASPRSRVLGSDEPAETPLRRVALTGLGCRISGAEGERTAEVFLAQPANGTVLVLRRRWTVPADEAEPVTGARLAARRLHGVPLHALATAHLVSESATRSASRVVRLASHRVARTRVSPLADGAWQRLPESVTAPDIATLERELAALPPRLVRPRVEAELVRVIPVESVRSLGYDPGDQRLDAVVADAGGTVARVSAPYRAVAPAALDCLAAALEGRWGAPRFVSGPVVRSGGRITVHPIAVLTDEGPVVPDLAAGEGEGDLAVAGDGHDGERDDEGGAGPLGGALRAALDAVADAAHQGLGQLTRGSRTRLGEAAAGLHAVGLHTTAGLLRTVSSTSALRDPDGLVAAWVDAQTRLTTAAELH